MVFYRKYRPQKIAELDNQYIREALESALSSTPPAHAFLFTGPKGLGKTSTARIVAKAVNCENKKNGDLEPCNKCDQCVSITDGTNMDVMEIDAASNRGIDEIRELKEKIRLSPLSAKMKVYIIDEVHMLTTEAFNALLKTLEEPPSHAMFILATTEPHKVPPTVISRCFHLSFTRATNTEIIHSLKRIAEGEKIEAGEDVLEMIADMSDGGFRDAAKIMEEISGKTKDRKVTVKFIEDKYQISAVRKFVIDVLKSLYEKDPKKGLGTVRELVNKGVNIKFFMEEAMDYLHAQLLSKVGADEGRGGQESVDFSLDEIRVIIQIFARAYQETKYAVIEELPLELAIIEYTSDKSGSKREENVSEIDEEPSQNGGSDVSEFRKKIGNMEKARQLNGTAGKSNIKSSKTPSTPVGVELTNHSADEKSKEWREHFWRALISEMNNHNHTVAGLLRGCSLRSYDKKEVVIETSFKFHKDKLNDAGVNEQLISICKMLTGNTQDIVVELRK